MPTEDKKKIDPAVKQLMDDNPGLSEAGAVQQLAEEAKKKDQEQPKDA